MRTAKVFSVVMLMFLIAQQSQAGVGLIMNGSFESDGIINNIAVKAPRRWCDVNIPAGKFGGWIGSGWNTKGSYSLSLYSEFVEFTAGDTATVSQQVYLTDVDQIIFDLRLGTVDGSMWDPGLRSALVLIDGNVVWDSDGSVPNVYGEYLNQMVDIDEIYKDTGLHTLSLAMRVDESGWEWFFQYLAQWDFVKFDAHCGGFGYLAEDLNHDCYVDMLDLKVLAGQWLDEELNVEYDLFRDDEDIVNFPDFAMFASDWDAIMGGGSDFNRSGKVDMADLQMFAEHWLGSVVSLMSDLSGDKFVNFRDYTSLTKRWLDNTDWNNWQEENCFELELPASDLDYDGIVNFRDFALLTSDWMSEGACLRSDIDNSGVVDHGDFSILADEWLLTSWLYGLE